MCVCMCVCVCVCVCVCMGERVCVFICPFVLCVYVRMCLQNGYFRNIYSHTSNSGGLLSHQQLLPGVSVRPRLKKTKKKTLVRYKHNNSSIKK